MSLYVLDTDVLTLLQDGDPAVIRNVVIHAADPLAITVISVDEQLTGWYAQVRRAKRRDLLAAAYQRLATNAESLAGVMILPFPVPAILRYENLSALKLNIGKMDLRIAAITLENNGILVTRNLRDFQRVPNLVVENWAV
jgi:tRNA(fMet)-specific endonuclease VapC